MSSDSGDAAEMGELEGELAEVAFEDLQRLKSEGRGSLAQLPRGRAAREPSSEGGERRRANKNRPMEMSSKRPVPRFREVIQAPKSAVRDPRFESLCGDYDESRFKKSYAFLFGDAMPKEAERLKKLLKKEKDAHRRTELQLQLSHIERDLKQEAQRKKAEEKDLERKKEEKELAESGRLPFHVTKSKRKRDELIEKFKELKAQGMLESFIAKRRRKNATKEHKKVPKSRRPAH